MVESLWQLLTNTLDYSSSPLQESMKQALPHYCHFAVHQCVQVLREAQRHERLRPNDTLIFRWKHNDTGQR